jgi:hypothetical protein
MPSDRVDHRDHEQKRDLQDEERDEQHEKTPERVRGAILRGWYCSARTAATFLPRSVTASRSQAWIRDARHARVRAMAAALRTFVTTPVFPASPAAEDFAACADIEEQR